MPSPKYAALSARCFSRPAGLRGRRGAIDGRAVLARALVELPCLDGEPLRERVRVVRIRGDHLEPEALRSARRARAAPTPRRRSQPRRARPPRPSEAPVPRMRGRRRLRLAVSLDIAG